MTSYSESLDDAIGLHLPATPTGYGVLEYEVWGGHDAFGQMGYGHILTNVLGVSTPTFNYSYLPGSAIVDRLELHDALSLEAIYTQTLAEIFGLHGSFARALQMTLTSNVGLHLAQTLARGVVVAQKLGLHPVLLPNGITGVGLAEALNVHAALFTYFGRSLLATVGVHDALAPLAQFGKALTATVGVHPALTASGLFLRVIDEDLDIEDADILQMLYQGDPLVDGLSFSIAIVDPGGGWTTWAINTRTSAVTEYQNWQFNSYVQIGNEYYGANQNGLWLLNNQTDNGANIETDVASGLIDIGGGHYTQLDGVYIGMRVSDNAREFILKLNVPDDINANQTITYVYTFRPFNMRSTRISIGKGFRHRYFQWELVSPGPDFDLDTIEFIPLISKRRVR